MKTLTAFKARVLRFIHSRWVNKYTIAFTIFAIWISFFDKHNLITQWHLKRTVNRLEQQKADYQHRLGQAKLEKQELESDQERFAREKYFMHRNDEEIYIIE